MEEEQIDWGDELEFVLQDPQPNGEQQANRPEQDYPGGMARPHGSGEHQEAILPNIAERPEIPVLPMIPELVEVPEQAEMQAEMPEQAARPQQAEMPEQAARPQQAGMPEQAGRPDDNRPAAGVAGRPDRAGRQEPGQDNPVVRENGVRGRRRRRGRGLRRLTMQNGAPGQAGRYSTFMYCATETTSGLVVRHPKDN